MSKDSIPVVPYQCMGNLTEEIARTIIRKASATISIVSSLYVLQLIYKKYRHKASSIDPYQRIMAGYCMNDIVMSFLYYFMGSYMTPKETGWWGAKGNTLACTIQGAMAIFAYTGIACYQVLVALFMVMMVIYGWRPSKFENAIERKAHAPIFVASISMSITPAIAASYNPECGVCFLAPLPKWSGTWIYGDGSPPLRGNDTLINVYWGIGFTSIISVVVFCCGAIYRVYSKVNAQERRMSGYGSFARDHFAKSKRIKKTGMLYTGSFFVSWVLPYAFWYVPRGISNGNGIGAFELIADFLAPLQGFFNMLVFLQPKCHKYQQEHRGISLAAAYFYVIFDVPIATHWVQRKMSLIPGMANRFTPTEVPTSSIDVDDGIGFGDYNCENRTDEANAIREQSTLARMESEGRIENESDVDLGTGLERMETQGTTKDGVEKLDNIEGLSAGGFRDFENETVSTDGGDVATTETPESVLIERKPPVSPRR